MYVIVHSENTLTALNKPRLGVGDSHVGDEIVTALLSGPTFWLPDSVKVAAPRPRSAFSNAGPARILTAIS